MSRRAGGRYVTVYVDTEVEVWVTDEDLAEAVAGEDAPKAAPDMLRALLADVTERLHRAEHDTFPWTVCSREPCVTADHAVNGPSRTGWAAA